MRKVIITILLTVLVFAANSQRIKVYNTLEDALKDSTNKIMMARIVDGDTLLTVQMRPIWVFPKRKFKSRRQRRRYTRMIRNVKKVYPYSLIVSQIYRESDMHLKTLKTRKEKRRYLKKKQKELRKKFEGVIRNMTYTQGRILIKLVDRQTGHTSYEIIKHFRGTVSAVFWQTIARLFKTNLKYEYNKNGDEKWIEEIVAKIENGQL